ncbi:MAG: phosphodiester glycosidase family protein [Planctomycetota bacterium]
MPANSRSDLATRWLSLLTLAVLVVGCARPAIDVRPVHLDTPDGPARGLVAIVDLARVDIVVSAGDEQTAEDDRFPLQNTFAFAHETGSDLAFNANFYGDLADGRANPVGLVINDGEVRSPGRRYGKRADAAIFFHDGEARVARPGPGRYEPPPTTQRSNRPTIQPVTELLGPEPNDAVAGVGASDSAPMLDTVLVDDGVNLGKTSRVAPRVRHPRTAVGVSRDNRTLIVMVIDGRQDGHSVGVTLHELADLMRRHGADDALNLDGGGSSSFVYRNPDGSLLTNRPSDGDFREVAVSVGVRVKD